MTNFWFRLSGFCLLWAITIIQYSKNVPVSILFFTFAVAVYFFLTMRRASLYLYGSLLIIIVVHGLMMTTGYMLTIFLLLYVTIAAAFWVKEKHLLFYMAINVLLSIVLIYLQGSYWMESVIMLVFFYFLIAELNRMSLARGEQQELYVQLLGEYRQLKRMNLSAEREARMEERTNIARDIHDSVGHQLTGLIMKLETLAIEHELPEYRKLKHMADESLAETREAVKALQTEENEGIASVVHLIRKLESQSHMRVQFTLKEGVLSVPLSNEKSVVLYRIIQEALTNAMRHSESRGVHVILGKAADGAVSFEIKNRVFQNKGVEFGFGLRNMTKRVEEIEGAIDIYSTEDRFIVSGSIPVSKEG